MSDDKSLTPDKVTYLSFQGGGGKGMTYVGAIRALQTIINGRSGRNLPLVTPWKRSSRIKGVSGASAGAITSLFVCMGFTADALAQLLGSMDFTKFFDGPDTGSLMHFVDVGQQVHLKVSRDGKTQAQNAQAAGKGVGIVLKTIGRVGSGLSYGPPDTNAGKAASSLQSVLGDKWEEYAACLYYDGGFFMGHPAYDFFSEHIQDFISKRKSSQVRASGQTCTFKQFTQLTNGVRLVVTGTNIWTQRSLYFSDVHTPDCPVAVACMISMAIPPAFKPIVLDCNVDKSSSAGSANSSAYIGLWLDGGILNNLPIHAFNDPSTPLTLNPGMLGLRLVDGFPQNPTISSDYPDYVDVSNLRITDYASLLAQTLLYPSTEGQMRTKAETDQTIPLYAQKLTTLDFNPSPGDVKDAQEGAENSVYTYFLQ